MKLPDSKLGGVGEMAPSSNAPQTLAGNLDNKRRLREAPSGHLWRD